jgi:hypothetical protein
MATIDSLEPQVPASLERDQWEVLIGWTRALVGNSVFPGTEVDISKLRRLNGDCAQNARKNWLVHSFMDMG